MRHRAFLDGLRKIAPVPFAKLPSVSRPKSKHPLDSRRRNLPKAGVGGSRLEAISVSLSPLLDRPGHRGSAAYGASSSANLFVFCSGAPAQIWGRFDKMGRQCLASANLWSQLALTLFTMSEMQIKCVRVPRRWLEKLMMWNRAYETTISDGYRQTIARGPTPWTSEKEAQRLWATSQQHADRSHAHH